MNEEIIKEIKSIYSSRIHTKTGSPIIVPEIKKIKKSSKKSQPFFSGVINKLNIVVAK